MATATAPSIPGSAAAGSSAHDTKAVASAAATLSPTPLDSSSKSGSGAITTSNKEAGSGSGKAEKSTNGGGDAKKEKDKGEKDSLSRKASVAADPYAYHGPGSSSSSSSSSSSRRAGSGVILSSSSSGAGKRRSRVVGSVVEDDMRRVEDGGDDEHPSEDRDEDEDDNDDDDDDDDDDDTLDVLERLRDDRQRHTACMNMLDDAAGNGIAALNMDLILDAVICGRDLTPKQYRMVIAAICDAIDVTQDIRVTPTDSGRGPSMPPPPEFRTPSKVSRDNNDRYKVKQTLTHGGTTVELLEPKDEHVRSSRSGSSNKSSSVSSSSSSNPRQPRASSRRREESQDDIVDEPVSPPLPRHTTRSVRVPTTRR